MFALLGRTIRRNVKWSVRRIFLSTSLVIVAKLIGLPEVRKWSEEKILQGQGKGREFCFESGKIDILKKSQGKMKEFNTAESINHWRLEETSGFSVISMSLSCTLNEQVEEAALLDLIFCISLARDSLFLSGKSQGILKMDACGNHVYMYFYAPMK